MSLLDRAIQGMSASRWFPHVGPKVVPRLDRFVHRITGGRVLPSATYRPALLLTVTGRKSGLPRTTPLMCIPQGEHLYLVASNYGRQRHPDWSANLIASGQATVDYRGKQFAVRAHLLSDEEKSAAWPRLTAVWPLYDHYAERSGRDLRVFRLERVGQ